MSHWGRSLFFWSLEEVLLLLLLTTHAFCFRVVGERRVHKEGEHTQVSSHGNFFSSSQIEKAASDTHVLQLATCSFFRLITPRKMRQMFVFSDKKTVKYARMC